MSHRRHDTDLDQGDQQAQEEEQPEDKGRREREKVQTCGWHDASLLSITRAFPQPLQDGGRGGARAPPAPGFPLAITPAPAARATRAPPLTAAAHRHGARRGDAAPPGRCAPPWPRYS